MTNSDDLVNGLIEVWEIILRFYLFKLILKGYWIIKKIVEYKKFDSQVTAPWWPQW